MRQFFFSLLFFFSIKSFAVSPFVFQLKNTAISNDSIILGSVDSKLCASSYLIFLSSLSEGSANATCISEKTPNYLKIKMMIPIKIEMISSRAFDISFSKDNGSNSFEYFSFRNLRNSQIGGGSELLGTTISMNNQSINAELEFTALVGGYNVKPFYTNTIFIDISEIP